MSKLTTAWAAGLFEGEGTITRLGASTHRWQVAIVSTDEDVLRSFQSVMGGKVYGPYTRGKAHYKQQWRWSIADKAGLLAFAKKVRPYLHARRRSRLDEAVADLAHVKILRGPHITHHKPGKKTRTT